MTSSGFIKYRIEKPGLLQPGFLRRHTSKSRAGLRRVRHCEESRSDGFHDSLKNPLEAITLVDVKGQKLPSLHNVEQPRSGSRLRPSKDTLCRVESRLRAGD